MPPEFLSVTPQRVRCYICGAFGESSNHWKYRLRLGGHSPICPSCVGKAVMERPDKWASFLSSRNAAHATKIVLPVVAVLVFGVAHVVSRWTGLPLPYAVVVAIALLVVTVVLGRKFFRQL